MKKIFLIFAAIFFVNFSAQKKGKDYSEILKSKNIYEINAFLRDAHPDDPRRSVLKPRVMEMMKDYIKNAKPGDTKVKQMQDWLAMLKRRPSTKISFEEMNANIKKKQIAKYQKELQVGQAAVVYTPSNPQNVYIAPSVTSAPSAAAIPDTEASEFNMLMGENPVEHKNKTVKILNSLFDNDPNAKECIVMIENKSDCNIIVRMEGVGITKYRLPVPAHGDNSIVVQKGDYLFTSIVCGAQYASQKTIQKPLMVALGSSAKK
ncbi:MULTISPECIES: DUF6759 domain-containing protein [Chryseobacterium]|uniref:DUF6759 domain-containing protein n=1 Tax=Chryseobacterium nepalense TaxID=1854498 RepID=A0ABY4K282_9FLAO|nr:MULTISPECIES: DUF6759 domain-containing protein [Chryseobacterium]MEA1850312.1 DUF6759 domain-containing protein [Chryseobacterium sp. MHB01]MEC5173213.1 hypothetical protein [Chryseobacterium nepalense]UPQ74265.1 hypothetical protein M0D58_09380 [Chryseobacterium nepalense]